MNAQKKEAELMHGAEMIKERSREIEDTYAVSIGFGCGISSKSLVSI